MTEGSDVNPNPPLVKLTEVIAPLLALYVPVAPPELQPPPRKMRVPEEAIQPLPPDRIVMNAPSVKHWLSLKDKAGIEL